jgi:hypothetical protein
MSSDMRNFLSALIDHWPVTIFLPLIILMILGFIVVTRMWAKRDRGTAEARPPAPATAPAAAPVVAPVAAPAFETNANEQTTPMRPNGAQAPQRAPGRP